MAVIIKFERAGDVGPALEKMKGVLDSGCAFGFDENGQSHFIVSDNLGMADVNMMIDQLKYLLLSGDLDEDFAE